MNVMDAATGKVRLSQATRNDFALVGEADLSYSAQIWCDPRALDLANAAVSHQIRTRYAETLIGPQEDCAFRPDYMAGAAKPWTESWRRRCPEKARVGFA
jgi:hypothetical protein